MNYYTAKSTIRLQWIIAFFQEVPPCFKKTCIFSTFEGKLFHLSWYCRCGFKEFGQWKCCVSDLQLHLLQGAHRSAAPGSRNRPAQTHWEAGVRCGRGFWRRGRERGRRRRWRKPRLFRVRHEQGGDCGPVLGSRTAANRLWTASPQSPEAPPPPTRCPFSPPCGFAARDRWEGAFFRDSQSDLRKFSTGCSALLR